MLPYVGDTGLPKSGDQAIGDGGPAHHCPTQIFRCVGGDCHSAPVPQHQSLVVTVGGVSQPGRQVGEEAADDLPRGGPGDGPGLVYALGELVLGELGAAVVEQPWFATGAGRAAHPEVDEAVAAWIAGRPRDEVLAAFEQAEAAIAPIYDARDVLADPQLAALGSIATVSDGLGPLRMPNVVSRLSDTPGQIRHAGRAHGADTEAVLADLGIGPDELARLREERVV